LLPKTPKPLLLKNYELLEDNISSYENGIYLIRFTYNINQITSSTVTKKKLEDSQIYHKKYRLNETTILAADCWTIDASASTNDVAVNAIVANLTTIRINDDDGHPRRYDRGH
jgi:hypothetical protein